MSAREKAKSDSAHPKNFNCLAFMTRILKQLDLDTLEGTTGTAVFVF